MDQELYDVGSGQILERRELRDVASQEIDPVDERHPDGMQQRQIRPRIRGERRSRQLAVGFSLGRRRRALTGNAGD